MKTSKILPWIIFGLVLVLAWMTIGGSSGYYDASPLPPNAPSLVSLVDATNPAPPPPSVSGGPAALGTSAGPGTAFSPTTSASGMGGPGGGATGGGPGGGAAGGRAAGGPGAQSGPSGSRKPKPPPEHRRVCIYLN